MSKRKASLGLTSIIENNHEPQVSTGVDEILKEDNVKIKVGTKKKQSIPVYVDPLLHEALHVLVFSERHKKTTFQTLFIEALDLLLKQRGLPSVEEISSGKKVINF